MQGLQWTIQREGKLRTFEGFGIDMFPNRKRPVLYHVGGNEMMATLTPVASFRNEEAAEKFGEWLSLVTGTSNAKEQS